MNQRIKHGPFWTGLFSVISLVVVPACSSAD